MKDVSSFHLILLAKESDLNKPQQWLLLCLPRSATDKNISLRAATSAWHHHDGTSQSRQSLSGFPVVLHEERTKIQRKSPQKEADRQRKHTFPTPVYLIFSLGWLFVCLFESSYRNKGFGQVFCCCLADILLTLLCQKLTLPFSYFSSLLSTLERSKHKQPELISQLKAL